VLQADVPLVVVMREDGTNIRSGYNGINR